MVLTLLCLPEPNLIASRAWQYLVKLYIITPMLCSRHTGNTNPIHLTV